MASSAAFELVLQLKDEASRGLNKAAKEGGILKSALGFATGGAILQGINAIGGAAKDMFTDAIGEAKEWQTQLAQVDAVLTSTGGAAGLTRDEILEMNKALSAGGGFSAAADDAVLSGQNMLLTFTNIGEEVFPEATKAMLDMATKMNNGVTPSAEQLKQQSIQLGKALNDPIKGISALSRVGVSFTQEQKDTIKTMVEAGDTMGAQKLILAELSKEFGGSATAAMNTFEGQQALVGEQFNNMKQTIGEALMPILSRLMGFVSTTLMPIFNDMANGIANVLNWFGQMTEGATSFSQVLFNMGEAIGGPLGAIIGFFSSIVGNIERFISALQSGQDPIQAFMDLLGANLQSVGGLLERIGPMIGEFVGNVLKWIGDNLPKIIAKLAEWGQAFIQWVADSLPGWLQAAGEFLGSVLQWIGDNLPGIIQKLGEWGMAFITWIADSLPGWLAAAAEFIGKVLVWIVEQIPVIVQKLWEWGTAFIGWVAPRIPELLGKLFELLGKIGEWIITDALPAIIGKLGEWGAAFLNWVGKDVLPFLGGKLAEIWNAITTWIADTARDIGTGILAFVTAFWEWITTTVQEFPGKVAEIWNAITTWIADTARNIWTKVQEIGRQIVEGIKQGILNAWQAFTNWLGGMFQGAVDGIKSFLGISSPSRLMAEQIGVPMVQGIQMGFEGEMPAFNQATLSKIAEWIGSIKVASQSSETNEAGSTVVGGIREGFEEAWGAFHASAMAMMEATWGEAAARAAQIAQMMANAQATGSASAGGGVQNPIFNPPWYGGGSPGGGNTGGVHVLGSGGIVTRPVRAIVGDGGAEAVIPLDRLERWMGGGRGMSFTANFYGPVYADESDMVERIAEKLYDLTKGR